MILYRDAGPADAAAVADLFRRSFVETFGHLYRPQDLRAFLDRITEAAFRAEIGDPLFQLRLAEEDGTAVAFAKLGPKALPVEAGGPALELRQLYVLAPWHGRRIAQALMDWVLERARASGAHELYLSVWTGNERAKAFYRRYGFAYVAPYAFMVGEQADEDEIWRLRLG
jgi:ribosomal protein S18 acetylase RimI-like enzyme